LYKSECGLPLHAPILYLVIACCEGVLTVEVFIFLSFSISDLYALSILPSRICIDTLTRMNTTVQFNTNEQHPLPNYFEPPPTSSQTPTMSPEYRATLRRSQGPSSHSNTRNRHPLRLLSLALALLSTCLSVAVIGTAGNAFSIYKMQSAANNPWWLPLWPGHFDTGGTNALIGAGAGIVLLNGVFVVLCLVPKVCLSTPDGTKYRTNDGIAQLHG